MQEADPTDALAVLGDETRVAILRALAEADEPLPFSDLRRRAGIEDPGRFNYHLSALREYFVREADGGYALRHAGSRVVAAAGVAETETRSHAGGDDELLQNGDDPETCPVCGDEDCERLFHVHLSGVLDSVR
ncbi:MAG: winged helix-turn-helix domain-containing protein [Halolamina sp.]